MSGLPLAEEELEKNATGVRQAAQQNAKMAMMSFLGEGIQHADGTAAAKASSTLAGGSEGIGGVSPTPSMNDLPLADELEKNATDIRQAMWLSVGPAMPNFLGEGIQQADGAEQRIEGLAELTEKRSDGALPFFGIAPSPPSAREKRPLRAGAEGAAGQRHPHGSDAPRGKAAPAAEDLFVGSRVYFAWLPPQLDVQCSESAPPLGQQGAARTPAQRRQTAPTDQVEPAARRMVEIMGHDAPQPSDAGGQAAGAAAARPPAGQQQPPPLPWVRRRGPGGAHDRRVRPQPADAEADGPERPQGAPQGVKKRGRLSDKVRRFLGF